MPPNPERPPRPPAAPEARAEPPAESVTSSVDDRVCAGHSAESSTAGDPGPDLAAAAALARARAAAAEKGLRPGSPARRQRRRRSEHTYSASGQDGRDPALLGEQIDRLLLDRGWNVDVSAGAVMGRWPVIVGADVAAHSAPVAFADGELLVRADSTAWATQLRYMSSTILGRLEVEAGPGVVRSLRIVGPSAPSWRKGPRRASGPGPRDTYG